jgi:aldose 1-epimerase
MKIDKRLFGKSQTGVDVYVFKIRLNNGACFEVTNYGATWVSAVVPDKNGVLEDVLLGFDNLEAYLHNTAYIGSTIGRFANRIAQASFVLNGETHCLEKNDGRHSNHSGSSGFHKRVFEYRILQDEVAFSLFSADGEGGFPGNLSVTIRYVFSEDMKVTIVYEAISDADTYVNLTNHAYFNLKGEGNIGGHRLFVPSTKVLNTDDQFIPTGEIMDATGSELDFSQGNAIAAALSSNNPWLLKNRGLNHCYVLPRGEERFQPASRLSDPESGRSLQVTTTQPAVIVYSAGFLETDYPGKKGRGYAPCEGICFETQNFPDYPNHPEFRAKPLKAFEKYEHETTYLFYGPINF